MADKTLDRTKCFLKDNGFYVDDDLGNYAVFGTNTGFCYKGGMEKDEAKEYAAEIAKNKADYDKFEASIS